jgi:hypothetical protein
MSAIVIRLLVEVVTVISSSAKNNMYGLCFSTTVMYDLTLYISIVV